MVILSGAMATLSTVTVLIGLVHLLIDHMAGYLRGMENLVDMVVVDLVEDTETWVGDMGT